MPLTQLRFAALLVHRMHFIDHPSGEHRSRDRCHARPVHAPAPTACGGGGRIKQRGGLDEVHAHATLIASQIHRSIIRLLLHRHMAFVSPDEALMMKLICHVHPSVIHPVHTTSSTTTQPCCAESA